MCGRTRTNGKHGTRWVIPPSSAGITSESASSRSATGSSVGRAEVTLTIDNSDGALPIEYSEVSITRRMFRDGAGEYEINGTKCRLMDVQELLSDSGIGREMGREGFEEYLETKAVARPA